MNCYRKDKMFPSFCLTEGADRQVVDEISRRYRGKNPDALIAHAAAEVEGTYYGKLTRVEEIIAFANRIGAKRIGIATCIGLIRETRVFVKVLKAHGLEPYTVCCKVGSVDKTEIGIPDELKVKKGSGLGTIDRGAGPIELVGLLELGQEDLVQLLPDPGPLPGIEVVQAGHATATAHLLGNPRRGCPS